MSAAVLLLTDDLMFVPRVTGAVEAAGHTLEVSESPSAAVDTLAASPVQLLLIDLSTDSLQISELVDSLSTENRPAILAYGPHVQEDRLAAARDAGCDLVVPRSRFSAELPHLLASLLDSRQTG